MSEDSLPATTPLPIPAATNGPEVIRAESFFVWKKNLLWKIRLADIGVKAFLILLFPLTISFYYIYLSSPRPTLWEEFIRLIWIPLVFLSGVFLLIQPAFDKSLRNLRKTNARDIDWSKEKFRELADALTEAGIDISKTVGRVEVADRWCIQFYQRPRHSDLALFLSMLLVFLFALFKNYQEMSVGSVIFLSLIAACIFGPMIAKLVLSIFDVFVPRLELLVTSRVISRLRSEPTQLRLLVAHEFSHEKHHDPLKKLFWKSLGEISRMYLSVAAFYLVWLLLIMIRGHSATPKIASVIALLLGMACWYVATIRVRKLIPLFQELRADLDAVESASDREALAEMFTGIPVESKFDAVLHRRGSLKATIIRLVTRYRRADDIRLISQQREHIPPRIEMLATGVINHISSGAVRRKLYFAYGSVFASMAALLYLFTR
jgi:Zn-dependent protease with chaperone function